MKRNWSKWILASLAAISLATPAMAVELKLSGDYELQGRYYNEPDWLRAKFAGAETRVGAAAAEQMQDAAVSRLYNLRAPFEANLTALVPAFNNQTGNSLTFGSGSGQVSLTTYYTAAFQAAGYAAPVAAALAAGAVGTLDSMGIATSSRKGYQISEDILAAQNSTRYIMATQPDVTMRKSIIKDDSADDDAYMKQIFNLYPELVITDKAAVKMKLSAFDNQLSHDDYGRLDDPSSSERLFGNKDIDSYNIFTIEQLYGDVTTDYGRFIFGKTPDFTGAGWFIKLPNLDNWAFGAIVHRQDEDENGIFDVKSSALRHRTTQVQRQLNSDDRDETGYIFVAKYDTENLDVTTKLIYGYSGGDNAETSYFRPVVTVNYAKDNFKFDAFARYTNGVYSAKLGNKNANVLYRYRSVADAMGDAWAVANARQNGAETGMTANQKMNYEAALAGTGLLSQYWAYSTEAPFTTYSDLVYKNATAAYVEASYRFGDMLDTPVTPIVTLAYASGAKRPDQVEGWFDDAQTFGTWLMDDKEEDMQGYFVTPSTGYMLKDPAEYPFDRYSFANIILARLGAKVELTKKTSLEGNVIWAEKASVDYLKNYNYEFGIVGLPNANMTIGCIGQYDANYDAAANAYDTAGYFDPSDRQKNNVKRGLGTEINGKLTTQFNDYFSLAWQASYLTVGDFYKSAFEPVTPFATARQVANGYTANGYLGSGLEAEPEWGLRWILQVNF